MVCGVVEYEEFRKAGIVEALEVQASQKPRSMLINGQRFVVELKPFKVSEFDEGMLDHYFHSDYADHVIMRGFLDEYNTDSWSDEEESYAAMKELMRFYFVGEEKTLCLTFKNWPDEAAMPFPKEVRFPLSCGTAEGNRLPTKGWRVEWDDGRKQSVHAGWFGDVNASFFDFVQAVKAERKRRGTDDVIEVTGALTANPTIEEIGLLKVTRPKEAVKYDGITYEFTMGKAWDNLNKLIEGRGAFVSCDKGMKKYFSSKDAKAFYNKAIEPKGPGRKGDGTYRLKI